MVLSMHSGIKKTIGRRRSGSPKKRLSQSSAGSSGSANPTKDPNSNVKVVVRVRPQNERETELGQSSIIKVLDENMLVFDPKEETNDFYFRGKRQRGRDLLKKAKKDLKLAFDRVFDGDSTNEQVFKETTNSVVDGLLNGYNCSVFAYGATGAGKTFTMLGNAENPGITFLTVMELYNRIDSIKDEKTCDVAVSYLEVYNENIHDLLMPSKALALREDPQRGVVVSGLSLHKPKNAQDLLSMLQFGNKNRTQHPTDANSESSRSHAVFIAYVKQQDRTSGLQANVRVAKMVLIDLAGSERATVTSNSGARMREGANINKSLLALGNCINSLADKKSKGQHVPYRDSKLTRLLKDSLGGNCQTVMIAAVSPSSLTYEDTYNTLRYADRAKSIKAHLKKNIMSVDMHVTKYVKIVEDLRKEITELKAKLKSRPEEVVVTEPCSCGGQSDEVFVANPSVEISPETLNLCEQIQSIYAEKKQIQEALLDVEIADRQLDIRIHLRRNNIERLSYLSSDNDKIEKSTQKADHAGKIMERKRARWLAKKPDLVKRLESNSKKVTSIEKDAEESSADVVKKELESCSKTVELNNSEKKIQHLQQMLKMQHLEASRSESVLCDALRLIKQQQLILMGHGFLSSDLITDFDDLHKQVEGCKEVVWADQEPGKNETKNELDIDRLINLPVFDSTYSSGGAKSTVSTVHMKPVPTPQAEVKVKPDRPLSPPIPNKVPKLDESLTKETEAPKGDDDNDIADVSESSLVSPELQTASLVSSVKNLGIRTTSKTEPKISMLSANILLEPPLFNKGTKRCLTKQFESPKTSLNETFEQPMLSSVALNETFEQQNEEPDLNGTYIFKSDASQRYTKPNVTFADAVKSPVVKRTNSGTPNASKFKTPSRSPLSAHNFSKKGTSSAGIAKKSGNGRSLKRHNSVHQLRSNSSMENSRMRKFSSTSTLPSAAMTRTALLRNIINRNSSSSNLQSKVIPDKKGSRSLRRFL